MKSLNAQNLARPVHGGGGGCVGGGAGAGAHHTAVTPHRDLVVSINSSVLTNYSNYLSIRIVGTE